MEEKALGIVILIMLLVLSILIYLVIRYWRKGDKLTLIYRDEYARSVFADARRSLFKSAMDGKIDPKDDLFKELYIINSELMRAHGNYKELGQKLITIFKESVSDQGISKSHKRPAISPEYFQIMSKTVDGFGYIAFSYLKIYRVLFWILKKFNRTITRPELFFIYHINKKVRQHIALQKEHKEMRSYLNGDFGIPVQVTNYGVVL